MVSLLVVSFCGVVVLFLWISCTEFLSHVELFRGKWWHLTKYLISSALMWTNSKHPPRVYCWTIKHKFCFFPLNSKIAMEVAASYDYVFLEHLGTGLVVYARATRGQLLKARPHFGCIRHKSTKAQKAQNTKTQIVANFIFVCFCAFRSWKPVHLLRDSPKFAKKCFYVRRNWVWKCTKTQKHKKQKSLRRSENTTCT